MSQDKPQIPNSVQEKEPFTTPMTPPQLAAEVTKISKMIADGQERCTKWTASKKATPDAKITAEEWYLQWLEHRALINNHYDLLMACQDPAGQNTLTYIPVERDMPAKLWQFGIYQYLELLRTRLPDAYEPLVCFLYTAYGLLGLLRETNPLFQDTWTECLGDLARYCYAVENNEEVREHWEGVSRTWYMYTSDRLPHVGRLYHHFAVLNRGFVVPQLCYWAKSLCVPLPFDGTRASIRKVYDPLFAQATSEWFQRDIQSVTTTGGAEQQATGDDGGDADGRGAASSSSSANAIHKHRMVDMTFALILGILFTGEHKDQLDEAQAYYLRSLDTHIAMMSKRWYQTGIAITCNLLGYWHENGNKFRSLVMPDYLKKPTDPAVEDNEATRAEFNVSLKFLTQVYEIAIRRTGDTNILPFAHTILTFLLHVSKCLDAMERIAERFPWDLTADMLNYWLFTARKNKSNPQFRFDTFPGSNSEQPIRPFPEDYTMRGLWYTDDYFPPNWFRNSKVEFEERYFERRSLVDLRVERILWIATQLSKAGDWLVLDASLEKFGAAERFVLNASA
ncbi:Telomerase-binding protein-like protein [Emericellopsis cladophorae]|uniref:Telomerase-binding protein-like protein n=1 Tax=Emericellopsis cladophorae TaxID=2686198 RepID=A0A9P9XTS1_9HYPO|nr:Telomerase-binding protein-like protein [Emericellopsis cladophorae]KAI6777717.1 Telomerase-binding protein-like protein [Emericellopsis cladophorae]